MTDDEKKTYRRAHYAANREKYKDKARAWYEANLSKARDLAKARYQANRQAHNQQSREWAEENRDRRNQISANYYRRNAEKLRAKRTEEQKARDLARIAQWKIDNPRLVALNAANRRARKHHATVAGQAEAIKQIYLRCPPGHHVDHEIPLRHALVCGLHTPANLQYLTGPENRAKSNSFFPDWL